MLRRRLPAKYLIGHGHIVDHELHVSGQFDVIIADSSATPILFEAENGCKYFPWESVYAVGEIKSTYKAGKRSVVAFAKRVQHLKTNLKRERTPANYIGNKIFLGKGLSAEHKNEVRDPLFQFAVFFDSGDLSDGSMIEEYSSMPDEYLPVGAFFLDGHMVAKAGVLSQGKQFEIGAFDFEPTRVVQRRDIEWVRISLKRTTTYREGRILAMLMVALSGHLNSCVLMPPSLSKYVGGLMTGAAFEAGFVTIERLIDLAKASGKKFPDEGLATLEWLQRQKIVPRG
jgi:hypothetical protein